MPPDVVSLHIMKNQLHESAHNQGKAAAFQSYSETWIICGFNMRTQIQRSALQVFITEWEKNVWPLEFL